MSFDILRRGRVVAGLALLLVTLSAVPVAAQMRSSEDQTMTANDGTAFVVTRAIVRVPESRAGLQPSGAIDLAVVRVRRPGQISGRVHAILAGGPGDSGVQEVLGLARQGGAKWFALMDGDIVGVDQRGTGASRPTLASSVRYNLPLDRPGSSEAWLPLIREASRLEAARLKAEGVDLQAYNTEESADDVEAVRRAFGYGKMVLWGRSYGSHLALATLRRHPEGVERLILVSPEGPDHTWKSPAQIDDVLARIAVRAGAPELMENIRKVLEDLSRAPVSVTITDPATREDRVIVLGKFDVQLAVAQAIGDPRALAGLPAAFRQMASGNYRTIGQLAYASRSRMGIQSAMKQAMDLSSGASEHRRKRIGEEARTALLGDAMNFPGMGLADAWRVTPLPAAFRAPVRSSVPVLMIVGDLDVRTPVANAREIAATLPNAQTVVVENAAHQFNLFGSPPLRERLGRFLAGQLGQESTVALPALPFQK
jgi:pimeloyl-ACP methyl ester carboxylesterase